MSLRSICRLLSAAAASSHSSAKRSAALPGVPTAAEEGYGALQSGVWLALLAPAGTPAAVVGQANRALNDILKSDPVRRKLDDLGAVPVGGSPEDASAALRQARTRWQALMRAADLPMR